MNDEELENSTKKMKLPETLKSTVEEVVESKLMPALPMTCYHLRPRKKIDRSLETRPNPAEFVKEITDIEGVSATLDALKKHRQQCSPVDRSHQYPRVVFLGTGSCIPNKTRNVSSILVHIK